MPNHPVIFFFSTLLNTENKIVPFSLFLFFVPYRICFRQIMRETRNRRSQFLRKKKKSFNFLLHIILISFTLLIKMSSFFCNIFTWLSRLRIHRDILLEIYLDIVFQPTIFRSYIKIYDFKHLCLIIKIIESILKI